MSSSPAELNNQTLALIEAGRIDEAEKRARRLLAIAPEMPEAHFNLGNILLMRGRLDEARVAFSRATGLRQEYHAAWFNLGITMRKQGDCGNAASCLQKALDIAPDDPETIYQTAVTLQAAGRSREAIPLYERCLDVSPDIFDVLYNLGVAWKESGNPEKAEACFRKALALQPDNAGAVNYLGICLDEMGMTAKAEDCYRKALELSPGMPEALLNLGHVKKQRGHLAEAEDLFRQAIEKDPSFAKGWYNLATTIQEDLRLEEAIAAFRRAIELEPDFVEAHWNMSHVLLLAGEYGEGFREYRWRWKRPATVKPDIPLPVWDGSASPGISLLVHTEQGAGDAIQFVRYLPLAREQVDRIILVSPASLVDLFQRAGMADAIVASGGLKNIARAADRHCPLLDLPAFFTASPEEIPASGGYLAAPQEMTEIFSDITKHPRPRVGVVWQGNPQHNNDHNRSCPYDVFRRLFATKGVSFFSLNKGVAADPADPVTDLAPRLENFSHTAAAISHLDLVISVDTSVAHLAGAMGAPVWTMLPYFPDWRWLISSPDSTPWYDSMRLFRQDESRRWEPVIERIKEELARMVQTL